MKKGILVAVVSALLIAPTAAMAKGGPGGHGGKGGKGAPKVMYVLKGTLSNYAPYTNSIYGSQDGSITITVMHANHHGKGLKGQVLTFPVGVNTKISLENGTARWYVLAAWDQEETARISTLEEFTRLVQKENDRLTQPASATIVPQPSVLTASSGGK